MQKLSMTLLVAVLTMLYMGVNVNDIGTNMVQECHWLRNCRADTKTCPANEKSQSIGKVMHLENTAGQLSDRVSVKLKLSIGVFTSCPPSPPKQFNSGDLLLKSMSQAVWVAKLVVLNVRHWVDKLNWMIDQMEATEHTICCQLSWNQAETHGKQSTTAKQRPSMRQLAVPCNLQGHPQRRTLWSSRVVGLPACLH